MTGIRFYKAMKMSGMELVSMMQGDERYKQELRRRLKFTEEAIAVMEIVQSTLTLESPRILTTTVDAMLVYAKEQRWLNGI
jgi:hypothetical protein